MTKRKPELKRAFEALLANKLPKAAREHVEMAYEIAFPTPFSPVKAPFAPPGFFKIPGYDKYAVNAKGEVYSKYKRGTLERWPSKNYLRVDLVNNDLERKKPYVHDLVLSALKGRRPSSNHVARHLNDTGTDNRIENLEWGTPNENSHDINRNSGRVSLTEDQRSEICARYYSGATQEYLAYIYDVSQATISRICRADAAKYRSGA